MPADTKMTVEEVRDKVEAEGGLGMTIQDYMSGASIADPKLAELWDAAAASIEAVEAYIEEHAEAEEVEPAPEPGEIVQADGSILCESTPTIFADVTKTDAYGLRQIDGERGGTLRLNLEGGRFGNCPEVYFRGEFRLGELEELMAEVAPHVEARAGETVRVKAEGDDYWRHLRFPRP